MQTPTMDHACSATSAGRASGGHPTERSAADAEHPPNREEILHDLARRRESARTELSISPSSSPYARCLSAPLRRPNSVVPTPAALLGSLIDGRYYKPQNGPLI